MGIYINSDLKSSFEGDLVLSDRGDLSLSNSVDSYSSVLNFLIRTDPGQYAPNPRIGCNLGFFVGKRNVEETFEEMKETIDQSISNVFDENDYKIYVTYFSQYESLCTIFLKGTYLIDNELREIERKTFSYAYPYIEGNPTILYEDLKQ